MKITHWIDNRKLVITTEQRESLGSDYQHFYNIPCVKIKGKITPLRICPVCNGSGDHVKGYDSCEACNGSGGLPENREN